MILCRPIQRRPMTAHGEWRGLKGLAAGILVPSRATIGLRFRNSWFDRMNLSIFPEN